MRAEKSYSGMLMEKGKENEEIILEWLKHFPNRHIIDFRDFRLAQRIDVDFGIETIDGNIVLAEIKSDNYISERGNFCFEVFRINHFIDPDKMFYLGWGFRSPANKLIVRNPKTNEIFIFKFDLLRKFIGNWVNKKGRCLTQEFISYSNGSKRAKYILAVETDKQKTTFNLLVPMMELQGYYKKYIIGQK